MYDSVKFVHILVVLIVSINLIRCEDDDQFYLFGDALASMCDILTGASDIKSKRMLHQTAPSRMNWNVSMLTMNMKNRIYVPVLTYELDNN